MRAFLFLFFFKNHFQKCLLLSGVGCVEGGLGSVATKRRFWALVGRTLRLHVHPKGKPVSQRAPPKHGGLREPPGRVTRAYAQFPPESDVTGQWCGLGIGAPQSSQAIVPT